MRIGKFARCLSALMIVCMLAACQGQNSDKKKVIGLSQCTLNDEWRKSMLREMEIALSDYDNMELVVRDADNDCELQKQQVQELADLDVDVLIISPAQPDPITKVAEQAYEAGIPTIITDRKISSNKYTAYIGGDNYGIGREAGIYAAAHLQNGARVLEVWGLPETSPAQERHQGFADVLKEKGILTQTDTIHGEWMHDKTEARLQSLGQNCYDLVFCHNDMMAIAVKEHFVKTNCPMPIIMGADAIYGAGLEAVADGRIDVSFLYPTCSKELVQACVAILNGDSVAKYTGLPTGAVDAATAKSLMIQGKSIEAYQQSINRKKDSLDELTIRFGFLENSLAVFVLLLIALITVFVVLLIYYFKLRKQNALLESQKNELELQRRRLSELNSFIEENSRRQLMLFAEISHEIRTPLTLIAGPIEKVCRLCSDASVADDLKLIRMNAQKLKTDVDRILDLGKLKSDKVRLNCSVCSLNDFTADAKAYFDGMARQKHIEYTFTPADNDISISFDKELMEKVIFNLLSNAFKFTPVGEQISVTVITEDDFAGFSIQDSGGGIDKPDEAFDYMVSRDRSTGTGIGLYLVKSYTELHGGKVELTNTDGGARFKILLPVSAATQEQPAEEYNGMLGDKEQHILQEISGSHFDDTILVVDDNSQMLEYVAATIAENYRVLKAQDGMQAMEIIAQEQVSLVVSDVMMPHVNGFELCSYIKDNIDYCHIPVVLLTALGSDMHHLQGSLHGADAYLSKPFSADLLKVTVYKLLMNKHRLNNALLKRLMESGAFKSPDVPVESLDDAFLRKLLARIDEIYADSSYNVEKLSDEIGMSRGHLYRKVKELTGVSPVEFLRHFRLKKAADLLKSQNMNVSEVCYATGFTSPAYFTKCFREYYKCTPTEFTDR